MSTNRSSTPFSSAPTRGLPMAQIALAWLLTKRVVPCPIVGATRPQPPEDAVAALDVTLIGDANRHPGVALHRAGQQLVVMRRRDNLGLGVSLAGAPLHASPVGEARSGGISVQAHVAAAAAHGFLQRFAGVIPTPSRSHTGTTGLRCPRGHPAGCCGSRPLTVAVPLGGDRGARFDRSTRPAMLYPRRRS
jgi:hypothetical protein